jgi:C-terminal processing protease CtpA/Prc
MYHDPAGDQTASLGAFFDNAYTGSGLKIVEVIEKGPLDEVKERVSPGMIINRIDGVDITPQTNYYTVLNHKAGKPTLINLTNPVTKKTFDVVAKPITPGQENELLYDRWVRKMRALTEKLSGGKIGYTHVRGMDEGSFRESFSEILGRMVEKKALIVDTRFNGGGWLHDDLASLLSGKKYVDLEPRGQHIGDEPANKWSKPSVVLMSESNYSDAHFFPFTYKALNIGKLVGMPVPGTATAVWWEVMQDNTIYFGIPQVGVKDTKGNYLENQQLEPDVRIPQDMDIVVQDRDEQLEKAVETLLKDLGL